MKILVYTMLNVENKLKLKKGLPEDTELIFKTDLADSEAAAAFESAEIILGNPPAALFKKAPLKLAFWQLDSAGFDQYKQVDVAVPVANMGTFFASRCAETIIGGILCYYRGINDLVRLQAEKKWQGKQIRTELEQLGDKKVIILGIGAIGKAVRKILIGFGCDIQTAARKNPNADLHGFEEILGVLPDVDLVINTLPGTANKFVSIQFLNAMKHGSVYSNVGRGNTTDEKALIDALETGNLAGAILDVTDTEPLPKDNKLWSMQNVILTQHTGGGDRNEKDGIVKHFISNVRKFIKGEDIEDLINLEKGY